MIVARFSGRLEDVIGMDAGLLIASICSFTVKCAYQKVPHGLSMGEKAIMAHAFQARHARHAIESMVLVSTLSSGHVQKRTQKRVQGPIPLVILSTLVMMSSGLDTSEAADFRAWPSISSTAKSLRQDRFMHPSQRLPTHNEIANFLETFLPPQVGNIDIPYLYHTPRHPSYNPARALVSRIIFSITPTAGVYTALNQNAAQRPAVCFLHRPWALDRRSVRRGSLILASHQSFDAHLTVGWNIALARRLGASIDNALCIEGYKDDPSRKIGLVAKLATPRLLNSLAEMIRTEFAGAGDLFSHSSYSDATVAAEVDVLAIMNAFHAEEVERVLATAQPAGWIEDPSDACRVLYLTGAARQHGLDAAAKVNMPAFCVGHRACEEWGIRYLAQETRARWPELEVAEVLEEEPPKPKLKSKEQPETIIKAEAGCAKDIGKPITGGA